LLSTFIEDYNGLLPDGVADSARCMSGRFGTCHSTMPAFELSANDSEETIAT